ncbi:LAMI_0E09582g1_1 [Lachancea mirantina]|uniref:LAMI_0E09582g1_1 n=1 Tax=Lachancea mirantina TaxID=1230905 RepID=A0A1G4JNL1_9SACH|nr:LAMI_0E09582g1_1 [Lachancea mirantina]
MSLPFALNSNTNVLNQAQQNENINKRQNVTQKHEERLNCLPKSHPILRDIRTVYQKANFSVPGHYEIIQILGKGSYGVVVSAVDKRDPSLLSRLAIKKVTNVFNREVLLKRAIRELKFLNFFRGHKNIVSLVDLELVTAKPYEGLYCYQELIDYDLARVIHSSVQFSEFHIRHFLYQILCGLKYIHSAEVIHRDLKPGNILCTINGTLKICDFGLARGVSPLYTQTSTGEMSITNYVATRWYRAPELILSYKKYTKAIDMWAVGCILAEFYGRKPAFMGQDSLHQVSEIMRFIGSPTYDVISKYASTRAWDFFAQRPQQKKLAWKSVYTFACDDAMSLLDDLLQWDPDTRPTVEQAIAHPFLSEVRNLNDEPTCPHGHFDYSYEKEFTSMKKIRDCISQEVTIFNATK